MVNSVAVYWIKLRDIHLETLLGVTPKQFIYPKCVERIDFSFIIVSFITHYIVSACCLIPQLQYGFRFANIMVGRTVSV